MKRGRRPRVWHVSPEGFRALRHGCLLSRQACAAFLGVGLRTVYHWEAGRSRIPFSAVRLLRLLRLGDLGALCDDWAGWTLNRLGLHDPAGRTYRLDAMRAWWITAEQARFWRHGHARSAGVEGVPPSGGALLLSVKQGTSSSTLPRAARGMAGTESTPLPADPLSLPRRAAVGAAELPHPPSLAETDAAAGRRQGKRSALPPAGEADGRRRRRDGRRSAPQGAGLVSSLKQVRSEPLKPKPGKASRGGGDAR